MKGYTIDCNYIIRVKDHMLRKPTKKLLDSDGSVLPLILIEVPR